MPDLFEKLIDENVWNTLGHFTEKALVAWFATKYPQKPLSELSEVFFLRKATYAVGMCRESVAKRLVDAVLANQSFVTDYENMRMSLDGNAVNTPCTRDGNAVKEKGKEKKKGFPPDPLYKEEGEKGKERTSSSSDDEASENSNYLSLSQEQLTRIRQNHVTQGTDGVTPDVAEAANIPCDQVSTKVPIQDEAGFETFLQVYPKRRGLTGGGYFKTRKSWSDCELKGWTTDLILAAVDIARKTENWQRENYRFVPLAYHFLAEERMREFLPYDVVCKALNLSQHAKQHLCGETKLPIETVALTNPAAFAEFCELYPKKRGLLTPEERIVAEKAWKGCEERGWHSYDIIRAVKSALVSQRWSEKDGAFIPDAAKFLNEEQMRQFLPIGFKTTGGSTLAKQPISAEKAFFLNPENFI